jgi:hypothetical protein
MLEPVKRELLMVPLRKSMLVAVPLLKSDESMVALFRYPMVDTPTRDCVDAV